MNICVNCRHCIVLTGGPNTLLTIRRCGASPYPTDIDPVSGRTRYIAWPATETPAVYTDSKHKDCRDINTHGNCDLYEAKS